MTFSKTNRRRGFTLMEILTVFAILVLLVGIAVPTYNRMKASARSSQCTAKLRQIGIALNRYVYENATRMPTMVAARENKDQEVPALDTVLVDYVSGPDWFRCPGDHEEQLWKKTGTSYLWNSTLNNQMITHLDFLGLTTQPVGIPVVSDKENFHESIGDEVNILYADGHVQKELQFVIDRN